MARRSRRIGAIAQRKNRHRVAGRAAGGYIFCMALWFSGLNAAPVGLPWLLLSNIRGDLAALEAVLAEVGAHPLAGILVAGDHCLGGPAPFEVWCRLQELGARLVRGRTDLALGTLNAARVTPQSHEEELRWLQFLNARDALGEVVCRRLSELPSTEVVSLDDNSGVMVQAALPAPERRQLEMPPAATELNALTQCVAEDVLVVGGAQRPFDDGFDVALKHDRAQPLLVVAPGAVGGLDGVAHAALLQAFDDGQVRVARRAVQLKRSRRRSAG